MHGRGRNPESMDDLFFGVHDEMLYARKSEPIAGILIFVSLLLFAHHNFFLGCERRILNLGIEIHVRILTISVGFYEHL